MAFDLAAILEPVSDAAPCGPDLDLEGDPEYSVFLARSEGLFPRTFFSDPDEPEQFVKPDYRVEIANTDRFLAETRDLRLLVLRAKLALGQRDLEGFAASLTAIRELLEQRWDAVHPQPEGGDVSLRMVTLATLDDITTVILPLQFVPLADSRRYGTISYRAKAIAAGEVQPREGEENYDQASVDTAFKDTELAPLIARRDRMAEVKQALDAIRALSVEKAGYDVAVSFDRLAPVVDKIVACLDEAVGRRDPAAKLAEPVPSAEPVRATQEAAPAPAPAATVATGWIVSRDDALAALAGIDRYFARQEPSSPALQIVRQARQLVGKSFHDVMRLMVPNEAEQARLTIGGTPAPARAAPAFALLLDRLAEAPAAGEETGAREDADWSGWPDAAEDRTEAAPAPLEDDEMDNPAASPEGGDASVLARTDRPGPDAVHTRQDALALLGAVGSFFRRSEPSSPVPLLTDRAAQLAEADFLALLKEFLPSAAEGSEDMG